MIALVATKDQTSIVNCPARNVCLMAGRRWGKTFTSRNRILTRCFQEPGFKYWYVAPVYAQCAEEFEALAGNQTLRPLIREAKKQPYPKILFENGSRVAYRSFDRPKNLRGAGIDEFWVDEIQDIHEADFYSVLRPVISDARGTLVVSGQFRGQNWYYTNLYKPGLDKAQPDYASFVRPTSSGIMFQGPAGRQELEEVKRTIPRVIWDQEYDCIPGTKMNAVFLSRDLERAQRKNAACGSKARLILSADLGKIRDPTAWVLLDAKSGHVVTSGVFKLRTPHEECARRLQRLARKHKAVMVLIDSTGGATGGRKPQDEYLKIYRKTVNHLREFKWSTGNKERVIGDLCVAFEQGAITIDPKENKELLQQLAAYEYIYRSGSGRYEYRGPGGHYDDLVAALAQAWQERGRAKGSGDIKSALDELLAYTGGGGG